jgi:hypothetical protein
MQYKERDELVLDLGGRLLDDADKLRLFMPDHCATFWFEWRGETFRIVLNMEEKDEET